MTGTTSVDSALGPLAKVLDEPDVVEISVNADQKVWVERFGSNPVPWGVMEPGQTDRFVRWCATWSRASILAEQPIFSGRIPGTAHRIEALVPPVVEAPAFSIRRHRDQVIALEQFLATDPDAGTDRSAGCDPETAGKPAGDAGCDQSPGTAVPAGTGVDASTGVGVPTDQSAGTGMALSILGDAIAQRRNILIAGATGCGKTTLLNSCLDHLARIAPQTRLITIEDTPEIQVPLKNTLGLCSSPHVSMDRLLVSTLRLAPDRIVVGEVREGAVLMTLIKAWDTGHPGGLTTLHANSAAEVLPRLRMLAMEITASDPTQRLMESLDMIVFLRRSRHRPVVETITAMRRAASPDALNGGKPAFNGGKPAFNGREPAGDGARTMETIYEI